MGFAGAMARSAAELWDDNLWEELLAYTEAGIVVPIIGPASYSIEIDGRQVAIDAFVAEQLVGKLALPAGLPRDSGLNEVLLAYLRSDGRRERIYPTVLRILQEARLAPPELLKQLAEIRHFNLFVTTAFDPLLEMAINEVRFGGEQRTQTIAYAPNNKRDLPPEDAEAGRPIVYHLFGRVSALPYSYAISDEDVLEFLHALQSESRRPEHLLGRLEGAHLLIIGGNFSDWVARMFLRTTKGKRLSESRQVLEILADNRSAGDAGLVAFLTGFSKQTKIFPGDAHGFIGELWQRWRERHGAFDATGVAGWVPPPASMPEGAIFISYAREDLEEVRVLKSALDAAGLSVWFDFDRLAAGDTFDRKIRHYIRHCSLFMPVLSHHTEARNEGFFRREWRYALDRDLDIDPENPFIIPVVIDDTLNFSSLPDRFREVQITALPAGRPKAEFIARLKQIAGTR
jgi:hypothetical protein